MATTFLGLSLPTPTVTLGPIWANEVNAAFEVIDAHDHTSGKGVQIPTAGLNINANLDFKNNAILRSQYISLTNRATTPSGSTFASSASVLNGDLYYTNASGVAVQITSGGTVVSSPANIQNFSFLDVSANLTILPSDTFVYIAVNTAASRQITLPLANAITEGRVYIIKDATGQSNTNNITLVTSGSDTVDGASSQILNSGYGSWMVVTDGVNEWFIS